MTDHDCNKGPRKVQPRAEVLADPDLHSVPAVCLRGHGLHVLHQWGAAGQYNAYGFTAAVITFMLIASPLPLYLVLFENFIVNVSFRCFGFISVAFVCW